MKKGTLIFSFFLFTFSALAQFNLDITPRFGVKSTWMTNKNIRPTDTIASQEYSSGFSGTYGLGISLISQRRFGVEIEALLTPYRIKYFGSLHLDSANYRTKIFIKSLEVPVLLFIMNEGGAFWELGPMFSVMKKATFTSTNVPATDVFSKFNKLNISLLAGFGGYIEVGHNLYLKVTLRLEYCLTNLNGVDALGREYSNIAFYKTPETTRLLSGGIHAGLTYRCFDRHH